MWRRDVDGIGMLALSNAAKAVALANSMAENQAGSSESVLNPGTPVAEDIHTAIHALNSWRA